MREIPPIMVLSEESPEGVTFRFKGKRWAVGTLIPGIAILWLVGRLYIAGHSQNLLLGVMGTFGLLLVYSSLYSATADQWLAVSSSRKTITFHKRNLYGTVRWERPPQEFISVKVGRSAKSSNWHVILLCADGLELNLGEHSFGAFSYERAFALATKIGSRTGIMIESSRRS